VSKEKPAPKKRTTTILHIEPDKDGNAIEIEGVKVTNPQRVLFPARKITKKMVIDYQLAIADRILPHIANRPLSLVRCPRGEGADCFFQKHAQKGFPEEFKPVEITEREGTDIYLYIEDKRGLVAAVQMGGLELHIWGSHVKTLEQPDRVVFDFDPDEEIGFDAVKDGAREMRDRLAQIGLVSFPMVTGGKGIHVVVPLKPKHRWDHIRTFSEGLARLMAQEATDRYLAEMSKAKRKGKIFIDYLRNGRGATAIGPYSTRAKPNAPVSWPVSWKAVDTLENAHPVTVENFREALKRDEKSDPWKGYFDVDQVLPLG
jgi:bifunctional non-homologous end joining protein LigD